MESQRLFEESREELLKIQKQLGTDSIVIDVTKLDGTTKNELLQSISSVISRRSKAVESEVFGVQ